MFIAMKQTLRGCARLYPKTKLKIALENFLDVVQTSSDCHPRHNLQPRPQCSCLLGQASRGVARCTASQDCTVSAPIDVLTEGAGFCTVTSLENVALKQFPDWHRFLLTRIAQSGILQLSDRDAQKGHTNEQARHPRYHRRLHRSHLQRHALRSH